MSHDFPPLIGQIRSYEKALITGLSILDKDHKDKSFIYSCVNVYNASPPVQDKSGFNLKHFSPYHVVHAHQFPIRHTLAFCTAKK